MVVTHADMSKSNDAIVGAWTLNKDASQLAPPAATTVTDATATTPAETAASADGAAVAVASAAAASVAVAAAGGQPDARTA